MWSRSGAGDATELYGGLSALGGKEEELPREITLIVLMATLSWTSTSHTHLCTVQCSAVESTVKPMSCLPRRARAWFPEENPVVCCRMLDFVLTLAAVQPKATRRYSGVSCV